MNKIKQWYLFFDTMIIYNCTKSFNELLLFFLLYKYPNNDFRFLYYILIEKSYYLLSITTVTVIKSKNRYHTFIYYVII